MAAKSGLTRAKEALRKAALGYPGATEDHPWGECAIKIKGKVFVFLSLHKESLYVTVKLPVSAPEALTLAFATPAGYGLGKSGWVTSKFAQDDDVPVDLIREWIDESFRAVAPKRVLAAFESGEEGTTRKKRETG